MGKEFSHVVGVTGASLACDARGAEPLWKSALADLGSKPKAGILYRPFAEIPGESIHSFIHSGLQPYLFLASVTVQKSGFVRFLSYNIVHFCRFCSTKDMFYPNITEHFDRL